MPNHTVEEFSRHNNAFALDDPAVSKFIADRTLPGRLLDPSLLYRHDQRTVEVRFVNGCQQAVCGILTAQDVAKSLGLSVEISAVSSFVLSSRHFLAIIARETVSRDSYIVLWDIVANKWESIDLSINIEGTVTAATMSSHGFLTPNETFDDISHGFHHLMVIGTEMASLYLIDISNVDGKFKIKSEVTQIQAPGSGIRSLHILLSSMTSKHMMDPKIYVGGDSGFLNVFKYKVANGNQFIIPSRNLTELLKDQDPVTHIECFRLQDHQRTVIIVGQSPLDHQTSNNKAKVTVLQTLTNSDRKVLGTLEASEPSHKTWKESNVLAIKSFAPTDLDGSHYLFAAFSMKAQSSTSTELVGYKINQESVDEVFRKDISECCYGVTLQDVSPARGASQCLLLFPNKLVKYNGIFGAEPLPDVNSIESSAKFAIVEEWAHFDEKAFKTCYSSKEVKAIQKQRKEMHGELFLDKLLKFAHVNVSLYPPRNSNDLHKLYNAIQKCDLDILRKHSLVYYLLLDWKNASQARYARRYLIPIQFQKLMDGYWAMDHGQYEDGVKSLADPGVEADWSDKILQTLYELSSHQLALQYATISKHRSDIPEDIILRMKLFVKCDIVRAFYFQREICGDRHDSLRETLLHILWEAIFTDENQEGIIERALSFPLNPEEEQIFVAYLSNSPHSATKVCLMHYYVAHDCQMQALELNEKIQSHQLNQGSSLAVSQHSKYVISKMCNSLSPLLSNVANRWQPYETANPAISFVSDGHKALSRIAQPSNNGSAVAKKHGVNLGKEIFVAVLNAHSKKRKLDGDIVLTDAQ